MDPLPQSLAAQVAQAFRSCSDQLTRLSQASEAANVATMAVRAEIKQNQEEYKRLVGELKTAKEDSTTAASALLLNAKPLRDRMEALRPLIGLSEMEIESSDMYNPDLLSALELKPADDYDYSNGRWPEAEYDDEMEEPNAHWDPNKRRRSRGSGKQDTYHADSENHDQDLSTRPPTKRRPRHKPRDDGRPRRKDEYGDTDDDESDDEDKSGASGERTSDKDKPDDDREDKNDDTESEDNEEQTDEPDTDQHLQVSQTGKEYLLVPPNNNKWYSQWIRDGEPVWKKTRTHPYLLACSSIIHLGNDKDPKRRYAYLACPDCGWANMIPGNSDYAKGLDGITDHCKKWHQKQDPEDQSVERLTRFFFDYEDLRRIAEGLIQVRFRKLECKSRLYKPTTKHEEATRNWVVPNMANTVTILPPASEMALLPPANNNKRPRSETESSSPPKKKSRKK